MIVICEECGKRYRIDPDRIKGKEGRFKCKSCGHLIVVSKPEEKAQESEVPVRSPEQPEAEKEPEEKPAEKEKKPKKEKKEKPAEKKKDKKEKKDKREKEREKKEKPKKEKSQKGLLFGLRWKMISLFLLIPIAIVAGASIYYMRQLDQVTTLLADESSGMVRNMAEDIIESKAEAVASEVKLYLENHPNLEREEFNYNKEFREIAVQKVGKTGYTALYELPDENGVWRTWAHVNEKIVGIDMSTLKKPLGKAFPGFWKVYTGVKGGKKSEGYYTWQDADGDFREKFMVCTPVEGTPFIIASTTYLDEFTRPMKELESRASSMTEQTKRLMYIIFAATIVIIGIVVSVYGHSLTRRIKSLTETAERISVGELDLDIEVKSRDEIGELADAISRMQDSIRLSIERLRRRR